MDFIFGACETDFNELSHALLLAASWLVPKNQRMSSTKYQFDLHLQPTMTIVHPIQNQKSHHQDPDSMAHSQVATRVFCLVPPLCDDIQRAWCKHCREANTVGTDTKEKKIVKSYVQIKIVDNLKKQSLNVKSNQNYGEMQHQKTG